MLERGYSIVTSANGDVVTAADGLQTGDPLNVRFARGHARVSVTAVDNGTHKVD